MKIRPRLWYYLLLQSNFRSLSYPLIYLFTVSGFFLTFTPFAWYATKVTDDKELKREVSDWLGE